MARPQMSMSRASLGGGGAKDVSLNFSIKDAFFDRTAIEKAIDKAEKRELSRIGAFVRKRARSSLRMRKGPSSPGSPPSVHTKHKFATLKNILFGYSPSTSSVVIGPVKIRGSGRARGGTVPNLHEFGGGTTIVEEQFKSSSETGEWYPSSGLRIDSRKRYRRRVAGYPARPFMHPALQKEIQAGTITNVWRSSIRAG